MIPARGVSWVNLRHRLEVWSSLIQFIAVQGDDTQTEMRMRVTRSGGENIHKQLAGFVEVRGRRRIQEGDGMIDSEGF